MEHNNNYYDIKQVLVITLGVIIGISVVNYKNFTFKGLIIGLITSFIVIAAISLFCIHTRIGRKLDKNRTKNISDKFFRPK